MMQSAPDDRPTLKEVMNDEFFKSTMRVWTKKELKDAYDDRKAKQDKVKQIIKEKEA